MDLPARCQFPVDIVCHRSFLWFLIITWNLLLSNWFLNVAYVYWWKWVHTFDTDQMSIPSILVFVDRRFLIIVWNYCQIILCWIWRLFVCLIMMILVFLKTQEELVGRVHPDSWFYVWLPNWLEGSILILDSMCCYRPDAALFKNWWEDANIYCQFTGQMSVPRVCCLP